MQEKDKLLLFAMFLFHLATCFQLKRKDLAIFF